MKTRFGLDVFLEKFPTTLKNKRLGVVCHNPSITSEYVHIVDALAARKDCTLGAIFGPQHGLYGQTQDNMVEWEGEKHPTLGVPVFSLYGNTRMPTTAMLSCIDALIIDLQDVGARPYTYIWTIKNCLQACEQAGLPVWVLDRPNPIGRHPLDGPMLMPDYFSFVGGAEIPLCHRMTMGEMALWLKNAYFPKVTMNVVWMESWWRDSLWHETGLPWVMPSPNMPTLDSALVYPGMVLLEATNISEGRGTTRPFELFGAPYIDMHTFGAALAKRKSEGCIFRPHGFIPSFQKWKGEFCGGFQIHVTDARKFRSVETLVAIIDTVLETCQGYTFKDPPYEYEAIKMPFDILAGSTHLRETLQSRSVSIPRLREAWQAAHVPFLQQFKEITYYPELLS